MRRATFHRLALFIACTACASVSWGREADERTAYSFDKVQAEALRLADLAGGSDKVLLVLDIDNTLLAMRQDLGSDQWFNWQRALPENDPQCVGDFDELLRVQALLYAIGSMRPTEPIRQPQLVKQLQDAGFPTLLLTSRGYTVRDSTRRELLANDYDFRATSLTPREGYGGPYLPYDPSDIGQSGITLEEGKTWFADSKNEGQIEAPRKVSFNEGVYMVAGQHKGAMLRMLLHKSQNLDRFKHILFVDDNSTNTQDVRDAFEQQSTNVVTFRYAREDANIRRFQENKHREHDLATLGLQGILSSLETMNVSRVNGPQTSTPQEIPVQQ